MSNIIEEHFIANKDRVRVRDEASNGAWLALNRGPLTRYAYRLLGTWEAAEDAVQESYARALSYIDTYKPTRSFDSWFFIILTRVCQQAMSDSGNIPEMVEADDEKLAVEEFLTEVDAPERYSCLAEWTKRADKVMHKLSGRDQNILRMFLIYGHKMSEVSQILGVNIHTVERVIFKNRLTIMGKRNGTN